MTEEQKPKRKSKAKVEEPETKLVIMVKEGCKDSEVHPDNVDLMLEDGWQFK